MARSFWRSSNYLEWLLDRQDVMIHRANDLKILGSEEEYQKVMLFFTDVIQAFGKSVEVRQQVIATALVYFKRFYSRNSFKTIDPWLMAPSCLFLASKVEDCSLVVFHPYRPLVQFCDELRPQMHEYADVLLERAW
ncbi:unnamed protein product [Schistosoma margrebowiei]|uniref:Cyclin-like domain-containing protein n=1 Tax=Schistosoma margrebowiei TaxID=48269 RepID=A0A183LXV9_9TREM|nr:unnamed protein product [Schistosoma margrebowiei]